MNILITAPSLNPHKHVNGISVVVRTIIKNKSHQYYHYCVGKKDNETKNLQWLMNYFFTFLKFPFFLLGHKINIVHLSVPFDKKGIFRECIFAFLASLFRKKIVAHFHGGEFFTSHPKSKPLQKIIAFFLNTCSQIIVLSETEQQTLKTKYNCKTNIHIIPNSVPTQIQEKDIRNILNSKETNSFIFLGRITKEKGIFELIEVLKRISKENTHKLVFYLCGTGPDEELTAKELGNLPNIKFHHCGIVLGEEKTELLKKVEYFILPSYFEGLPIALLEAMSTGCIPIVTNVGSMADVVIHDETGYIVKSTNTESLYESIILAIISNKNSIKMAEQSWKLIETKFNSLNYLSQINNVYTKLCK